MDDVSGELDSNRPVPFRLTPNVYEFISEVGVRGPLTASMISAARCLVHPNFKVQAILRYVASKTELQGDHSGCFLGLVDLKTEVAF